MASWLIPGYAYAEKLNLKPLALYASGGIADAWSSQPPKGLRYWDKSFAGPRVGPAVTTLCFAGADLLLQKSQHPRWAKALRVVYVVGITGIVIHNRSYR
jgi:hypothetical protein